MFSSRECHWQARNQKGATGQLPHPKFSKTYLLVWRNNKLQSFCLPWKYQLVARWSLAFGYNVLGYVSLRIYCVATTQLHKKIVYKTKWSE